MKLISTSFALVALLLFSNNVQSQTYTVSATNEAYTPLTESDTLDDNSSDTLGGIVLSEAIAIGFDFEFQGKLYSSLRLAQNGFAVLAEADVNEYWVSIYDCRLKNFQDNASLSPIRYSLEGDEGSRIFKCEYVDRGFIEDPQDDDKVSFQLWLYESCGDFEIRVGPSTINSEVFPNEQSAPFIGYGNYVDFEGVYLSGDPMNPILQDGHISTLNVAPEEGTVYRFSTCALGIPSHVQALMLTCVPNPVSDKLNIQLDDAYDEVRLSVFNTNGQLVTEQQVQHMQQITLNMEELPIGVYTIQVRTENALGTYKVIKDAF